MSTPPYTLTLPKAHTTSVVFASPHSGRDYPPAFMRNSALDEQALRSSEDAYVDQLYAAVPDHGAPFLMSNTPRAYVDLNRGPEELDPALINGLRRVDHNPRVSSGLGVVPRVVAGGRAIYRGKMSLGDAQSRLATHWHPYHTALQSLLDRSNAMFGEAILIDCHSMPHEAVASLSKGAKRCPQIVLGDRYGASAAPEIVGRVEDAFVRGGFDTARNTPFSGAYIAQHYGRPSRGQHVVQVEIDRSLYLDERMVRPNADFAHIRARLASVIAEIAEIGRSETALAAE
ncbi:N-formylglutamate deformylase [Aliiroseovarius sediminilitoris]|uniref:N-formylglutamate deformylase n=1 Tax=Aliiroseovarius sediminilitoris TaxID=1173584 RepID=A0A1I0MHW8_9RHOB|nr:N-formylglutamate amidohydrolase [Aliiroseovarius sediminilitoris]SEV87426.1 N-formylglutamate deformylase [Aliiroseovarius sediminilitoris]